MSSHPTLARVIALSLSAFDMSLFFGISFFTLVTLVYIEFEYSLLFNLPASIRILQTLHHACCQTNLLWLMPWYPIASQHTYPRCLHLEAFQCQYLGVIVWLHHTMLHAEVAHVWWIPWRFCWTLYYLKFSLLYPCTILHWVIEEAFDWFFIVLLIIFIVLCVVQWIVLVLYLFEWGFWIICKQKNHHAWISRILTICNMSSLCFWRCFIKHLAEVIYISILFELCCFFGIQSFGMLDHCYSHIGIVTANLSCNWNLGCWRVKFGPCCIGFPPSLCFLSILHINESSHLRCFWRYHIWPLSLFQSIAEQPFSNF